MNNNVLNKRNGDKRKAKKLCGADVWK